MEILAKRGGANITREKLPETIIIPTRATIVRRDRGDSLIMERRVFSEVVWRIAVRVVSEPTKENKKGFFLLAYHLGLHF
jgi:hypothetical protein